VTDETVDVSCAVLFFLSFSSDTFRS